MNKNEHLLTVAFESERLSYSNLEVDLHNSGINQILSICAARGHSLYHFSMQDLFYHEGTPYARASVLELPKSWQSDPLECYTLLSKIDERPVPLIDIDLCFFRADDVRHSETPNIELMRSIEENGVLIETVEATLSTTDKYELVKRAPKIPQPLTFAVSSVKEALAALKELPNREGFFVL